MPEILGPNHKNGSQSKESSQLTSLQGHVGVNDLGSRVVRFKPSTHTKKRRQKDSPGTDNLYAFAQSYLQDISPAVLQSACSMLVDIIQDETMPELKRQPAAETILGPLSTEEMGKLISIVNSTVQQPEAAESEESGESDSASSINSSIQESGSGLDSEYQTESEEEDETQPEWATNPYYLKNMLAGTDVAVGKVLKALESEESEEHLLELFHSRHLEIIEILLKNKLSIYWYTKYLNAETGPARVEASQKIDELGLKTVKQSGMETIDLDSLMPSVMARFSTSSKLDLPSGSEKTVNAKYEQYTIPALDPVKSDEPLVSLSSLPDWAIKAFPGVDSLNRVQSKVYPAAFESGGNLLLCSPTGSGKTNVALLCILRCIERHQGTDFKMVYISPLKALVQEQVRVFSDRLAPFGINVAELSGDSNLSSDQIGNTQLIVSTPEKWDITTRKGYDNLYTSLVRLVIIDEIHLLHDPRGPALESIIARSHILSPQTRLIGLSATLPNYRDVASFLRAENVFNFDSTYRPCPLKQEFVGITVKSAFKRHAALNDICYEKLMQQKDNQSIVFVHSRKDTLKTAEYLVERDLDAFPAINISEKCDNEHLASILGHGIGIHHAGLSRNDRNLVESLFLQRKLKVLVSTATLAWGVNLPAHAVIIKGTQVYDPQEGQWVELSPQDVLQMLGRAGRPGFDTFGEGIVITLHDQLAYYMSVLTAQFPIESQLIPKLLDCVNAEVCLGTIKSVDDGVDWLGKTYYFTRLKSDPQRYRAGLDYEDDGEYFNRRKVIIHSALSTLHRLKMVSYDGTNAQKTDFGRIAASFYINPVSMATYGRQLKPYFHSIDIARVFARSDEFKNIPVRPEEKIELERLANSVPIPIKDEIDTVPAKVSVLLQVYIERLELTGYSLSADMIYINQSASRLIRAMYELAVAKRWAALAQELHDEYLMVDKRMWLTSSPFRQFHSCPLAVIRKTENSAMPWSNYLQLRTAEEVAKAIRDEEHAEACLNLLNRFPKVDLTAIGQPITPTLLQVNVAITPEFVWDISLHGKSQRFIVTVVDGDGEFILHHESLIIRQTDIASVISLRFAVPIIEPLPAAYFVSVKSDTWLHSNSVAVLDLENIILPAKFTAPTPVVYMDPIDVSDLDISVEELNVMQSQVYDAIYRHDDSVFIGLPETCGWDPLCELAISRHLHEEGKILLICTDAGRMDIFHRYQLIYGRRVTLLTDRESLAGLAESKIAVTSPAKFDAISKLWPKFKQLQVFNVVIVLHAHLLGSLGGHILERVLIRLKIMATQLSLSMRYIAISLPTAGSDLGRWFGASKSNIFNYRPCDTPVQPKITFKEYDERSFYLREQTMLMDVAAHMDDQRTLVFVYSREKCIQAATAIAESLDLGNHATSQFTDPILQQCAELGVPFIYTGMSDADLGLALGAKSRILVCTFSAAGLVPSFPRLVILNTQFYDFGESAFSDYTAVEIISMCSRAEESIEILTTCSKVDYYKQFLQDSIPVESSLVYYLSDSLMVEVAERSISNAESALDWLSYSYFFHRLGVNPSYYGLNSTEDDSVNEYLSELVETSFEELNEQEFIEVIEDEDGEDLQVKPLDGALVSSAYNLSLEAMVVLNKLDGSAKLETILSAISQVPEFACLPVDARDLKLLESARVPFNNRDGLNDVQFKAFMLIQMWLSRSVPTVFEQEVIMVLKIASRCVLAVVDLLSSQGALNALIGIDLHQMLMQALWNKDSSLKQIPFVDTSTVQRAAKLDIVTIQDFLSIEDAETRNQMLGFDEEDERMIQVADFANQFPSIEISARLVGENELIVDIERDIDEDCEEETATLASTYNHLLDSPEQWYIFVGSTETRELYGVKKIRITASQLQVRLSLASMDGAMKVWCVCSAYLDADKEVTPL